MPPEKEKPRWRSPSGVSSKAAASSGPPICRERLGNPPRRRRGGSRRQFVQRLVVHVRNTITQNVRNDSEASADCNRATASRDRVDVDDARRQREPRGAYVDREALMWTARRLCGPRGAYVHRWAQRGPRGANTPTASLWDPASWPARRSSARRAGHVSSRGPRARRTVAYEVRRRHGCVVLER
jgi:hypothetical protein